MPQNIVLCAKSEKGSRDASLYIREVTVPDTTDG